MVRQNEEERMQQSCAGRRVDVARLKRMFLDACSEAGLESRTALGAWASFQDDFGFYVEEGVLLRVSGTIYGEHGDSDALSATVDFSDNRERWRRLRARR
jgi:hypothetical protein